MQTKKLSQKGQSQSDRVESACNTARPVGNVDHLYGSNFGGISAEFLVLPVPVSSG